MTQAISTKYPVTSLVSRPGFKTGVARATEIMKTDCDI